MAGAAKKGTRPATPRPRAGAGHSRSPTIEERIVGGGGGGASEGACVTFSVAVPFPVSVAGLAKAAATRGPATAAAATVSTTPADGFISSSGVIDFFSVSISTTGVTMVSSIGAFVVVVSTLSEIVWDTETTGEVSDSATVSDLTIVSVISAIPDLAISGASVIDSVFAGIDGGSEGAAASAATAELSSTIEVEVASAMIAGGTISATEGTMSASDVTASAMFLDKTDAVTVSVSTFSIIEESAIDSSIVVVTLTASDTTEEVAALTSPTFLVFSIATSGTIISAFTSVSATFSTAAAAVSTGFGASTATSEKISSAFAASAAVSVTVSTAAAAGSAGFGASTATSGTISSAFGASAVVSVTVSTAAAAGSACFVASTAT